MVVTFSPLDNIIVISVLWELWELLHRNVIVSHIILSTLKARQTIYINMSMLYTSWENLTLWKSEHY